MAKSSDENNPQPEKSPGGSIVYRHDKLSEPRTNFTTQSAPLSQLARDEAYRRLFGEAASVSHEVMPRIPHVDVFTYYRRGADGRKVCTLVTGGMSDLQMNLPAGAAAARRVELIFYCDEPRQEYIDTIRWLAHFPHNQRTWVGSGSTIPNGNPPAPFWGSSVFDTILLLPPIVKRDRTLLDQLVIDGEPVHFLWLLPVTTAECNLKLAEGVDALLELFGQNCHPHVFDPNRKSYV